MKARAARTLLLLACACLPANAGTLQAFNGARAMGDIGKLLEFTPRSLGKPGHDATIAFIMTSLKENKAAEIRRQDFHYTTSSGKIFTLTNIIARLDPGNPRRIIVATHYDSIVRAYRDSRFPDAAMPGANNSASGVALLLETFRALSQAGSKTALGVDFIFFDGEEGQKSLGAGDGNWFALGSPYFAHHLQDFYAAALPESAVDFDMVCARDAVLQPEPNSLLAARRQVSKFWTIGEQQAPSLFSARPASNAISDDHSALINAGIPSILIIGWKYDPWFNTTHDTQDKCSAETLSAVGQTLLTYLYAQ